jgi:hypothetical protein
MDKERVLNRKLNRQVFNRIDEQGGQTRAELRTLFSKHGENVVKEAIRELIFFGLVVETGGQLVVIA